MLALRHLKISFCTRWIFLAVLTEGTAGVAGKDQIPLGKADLIAFTVAWIAFLDTISDS